MSELEDKLNSILSSPEEMQKIFGLAQSLSGSLGGQDAPHKEPEKEKPKSESSGFSFGDIDPKMLGMLTKLMGSYSSEKDDKAALFSALKPYLRPERQENVDQALKIAKMAKIAKIAFTDFSGGDNFV